MTTDPARLVRWARSLPDTATLDLACAESPALAADPGHEVVQLTWCLQDSDPADLFEVAAAAPQVLLRLDGCRRRGIGSTLAGALELAAACALTRRLDATGTGPAGTTGTTTHDVTALPPSRRQLWSWLTRTPPAEQTARGLPAEDPQPGPARILAALRTMGAHPSGPTPDSPSLALASTGCTACDTCVRVCHTDALSLDGDGDTRHLVLRPDQCVGCGDCLPLCPVQALRDTGAVPWGHLLAEGTPQILERLSVRRCQKCRAVFAGAGTFCQTCAMRRAAPFGSWLPPGFRG